jgi:hypothetical protein
MERVRIKRGVGLFAPVGQHPFEVAYPINEIESEGSSHEANFFAG